jgi:hypothetical protein
MEFPTILERRDAIFQTVMDRFDYAKHTQIVR